MASITYKEIDKEIEKQIVEIWGNWVTDYGCLHYGDDCYSLAAMCDGKPVGFVSTYPLQLPSPLDKHCDAFIDDIEVHKNYRRQGIATKLLSMTESWAKSRGYRQIRAWSSDDKTEAIQMWYALGYGVCPAVMRGESILQEYANQKIYGFYLTKVLSSFPREDS